MEMPNPTDDHKKLETFLGTWTGEEKLSPTPWDPLGGKAEARLVNRSALGGLVVVQDYEQRRGGKVSFEGHAVIRYDATQQEYAMHWFDSMGMPPNEYRGKFDGDVLTLTNENPRGHSRATYELGAADSYKFTMEVSPNGKQWIKVMRGSYSRSE